jgi:hypothetical protein
MYIGIFDWWREHFGRTEPVIFALVLVDRDHPLHLI